jgi:NAD(P)-dependent dehydrogenase (short-subunit alcohol dehydrogenase family)
VGSLDGRITVITGAGRGLGRAHALLFAAEGAKVVVNDLGSDPEGGGGDPGAAEAVVEEIRAAGGEAVANHDDVATWAGGEALIRAAVDAFGGLDVLVNNAGILRDRALVHMTEDEWDSVTNVHLKGHFVPTRFAAEYWRDQAKAGTPRAASVIHTSSTSGLLGNPGQTNYGTAKAGVAAFSQICAQELSRYGVRSNCIVPAARTRLTAHPWSATSPAPAAGSTGGRCSSRAAPSASWRAGSSGRRSNRTPDGPSRSSARPWTASPDPHGRAATIRPGRQCRTNARWLPSPRPGVTDVSPATSLTRRSSG